MIKLICFDLDGVLVESKDLHYQSLNEALYEHCNFKIDYTDHIKNFDGLPTKKKLDILKNRNIIKKEDFEKIWELKQNKTIELIYNNVKSNDSLIKLFKELKEKKYIIYVCSNSIRKTVIAYLYVLKLFPYIDNIISNEDVISSKPHPEIYYKAMMKEKVMPYETVIIEDSQVGIESAKNSNANIIKVLNPEDLIQSNITSMIDKLNNKKIKIKWENKNMNVLIPMAGKGSRFVDKGFSFPKPLIEVKGKTMIEMVTDNLNVDAKFIYIVLREHYEKYNLGHYLKAINPNCEIVIQDDYVNGAACTAMLAKELINNDKSLLIANSDQFIDFDSKEFLYFCESGNHDGVIMTFYNTHPKWSYAKLNDEGYVENVAEKKVISNNATVGIYYWRKGKDFVSSIEQMMDKNIKVNNEFYICPSYNEAISNGLKIKSYNVNNMWGTGDPESLLFFLENYKGEI